MASTPPIILVFMKLYFAIFALVCSISVHAAEDRAGFDHKLEINTEGTVISLTGPLFKPWTDSAIELVNSGQFDTLRIDSRGGEVIAAMELGNAIHAHGLAVVVTNDCNSSCANYIFPAGRRRTIEAGGIVLWHGDARQRNFVARFNRLDAKEKLLGPEGLTSVERSSQDYTRQTFAMQAALYKAVGIDGRIARIGQEKTNPVSMWALSKGDMEKFGLNNIDAPSDYASEDYCKTWASTHVTRATIHCQQLKAEDFDHVRVYSDR